MRRAKKMDDIDRPAVIGPDHARDRTLGAGAGARKGGSCVCKERCTDTASTEAERARAAERYAAAKAFDEGWQLCAASWPGSCGFERVRGGGGTSGAFADHQRDVKDYWRRVEAAMGANDWLIVRLVCGENYTVAQAVSAIGPGYKFSTLARFREALDGLVAARRANSPCHGRA